MVLAYLLWLKVAHIRTDPFLDVLNLFFLPIVSCYRLIIADCTCLNILRPHVFIHVFEICEELICLNYIYTQPKFLKLDRKLILKALKYCL